VYDDELLDAINALESSTAAIEKQTEMLNAQREALISLMAQCDEISPRVERANTTRNRRRAQEAGHLSFDVEELSASVKDQFLVSQKQATHALQSLISYASDRLSLDDRKLEAMFNLSGKIEPAHSQGTGQKAIEQWCQALIRFRTSEIKTRVETIYQTKLADVQQNTTADGESDPQIEKDALEAELQTLRDEISSVAEMVVDHDLRSPISTSVQNSERSKDQSRHEWLAYIHSSLNFMCTRLRTLSSHTQDLDAFQLSLQSMVAVLTQEIPQDPSKPKVPTSEDLKKRRRSGMLFSANVPVLNPSAALSESTEAERALRYLDVASRKMSNEQLRESLRMLPLEKELKLHNQYAATELSSVNALQKSLGQTSADLLDILGALYSSTDYATVQLSDATLHRRLADLDSVVEETSSAISRIDVEADKLEHGKVQAMLRRKMDTAQ